MKVIELDDENYDKEVMESNIPVIIDFWAEWCGPCKMFMPIFSDTAEEFAEKVKFAKVNVDSTPDLAMKYNVRSIPTIAAIKDKSVVAVQTGSLSRDNLKEFINSNLLQ